MTVRDAQGRLRDARGRFARASSSSTNGGGEVEKIRPYRRDAIPQATGWWCGPAATRIVLEARGIHIAEAELAREIGTHQGGTDHIGWITDRSLRHRVPEAGYEGVPMHQDPPTAAQEEALWDHIRRSINAGWGLVVNWVAPPGNHPRGIRGSASPRYNGTVYHYVAYMGYAEDEPQGVWVVDSGFAPWHFWVSRKQAATLIPPKAYAWPTKAAAAPIPAPPPAVTAPLDTLTAAMQQTAITRERMAEMLPYVSECLERCQCHSVERIAMWCAQIGHESAGLRYMREIASGQAYEGRQDLGNTQPGDGQRFAGRGPIQITGRHNYTQVSQWAHSQGYVPTPTFFVDDPALLETPKWGFLGTAWYWTVARPGINGMADRRDLEGVTRAINGGLNGLADRRARWDRCLGMGARLLELTKIGPPPTAPEEGFLMALTPDEQREVLDLLRVLASDRTASISPFRHLGGEQHGAVTMSRRVDFIDANLHTVYAMLLASIGDPHELALLSEVASAAGNPQYPDRQEDAARARLVLAWAAETGRAPVELPPPPVFRCEVTGTNTCIGGGADTCSLTTSGRCIRAEYGAIAGS